MQHITGISRQQLQLSSLEDRISPENPVRFIEAFVEHISLEALGFITKKTKTKAGVVSEMQAKVPTSLKTAFNDLKYLFLSTLFFKNYHIKPKINLA
jgi:hypothetical protein